MILLNLFAVLAFWSTSNSVATDPKELVFVTNDDRRKPYDCKSAVYFYAVVSGELSCPPECNTNCKNPDDTPSTQYGKCTNAAVEKVCKDGNDAAWRNCDPVVYIDKKSNYDKGQNRNKDNIVPWILKNQAYKAYYYNHWDKNWDHQYVYQVTDTNVQPGQCARLVVKVEDRNKENQPFNAITKSVFTMPIHGPTHVPYGYISVHRTGTPYFMFHEFNTKEKCGPGEGKRIKYNMTFVVGMLEYVPSNGGRKVCRTNILYNCRSKKLNKKYLTETIQEWMAHLHAAPKNVVYDTHESYSVAAKTHENKETWKEVAHRLIT